MCGITACVGSERTVPTLLTGLDNLEYRGYDSAGIAIQNGDGLSVFKQEGEVEELAERVRQSDPHATTGIGHTRWSTHGPPTDGNAHPHTDCTGEVAIVHNGIIENYADLRSTLKARGHELTSDTDTEVVPHLVEERLDQGATAFEAFRYTVDQLEGSYALAMVVEGSDEVYATREGSPLVLGVGEEANFLASDVPAFLEFTGDVVYLENGDTVVVDGDGYEICHADGEPIQRPVREVDWTAEDAEKGGFDHYMLKEIHEQPTALRQTVRGRVDPTVPEVDLEDFPPGTFADVDRVRFIACGTSYHAALYAVEVLGNRGVPAEAVLASEYTASAPPSDEDTLVVGVTQSGETADTLNALAMARDRGHRTVAVTNVVGSTAARTCDDSLFIRAGPEIGVAATKTFSSQIVTLCCLAERVAADTTDHDHDPEFLAALRELPDLVEAVVDGSTAESVAGAYRGSDSYFFVGRNAARPVALEGALKLKEISYEHAEGFAAGELKHGPLALVTESTPVFAVATGLDEERMVSTTEEVQAREGPVIAATPGDSDVADLADHHLAIPSTHPEVAGVLANVQLQLFAYYTAESLDRSIDKPRNLAKSVTVE